MGKTSSEVKKRWIDKAYKRYQINLRYDTDQPIIDYMEEHKDERGTTPIVRDALAEYIKKHK